MLAQAIFALESSRRWALAGTPIQNRLTDLASLFRFLRVYPFDDPETFRQQVSHSWKTRSDPQAIAKLRMLINSITIRRPKKAINLPSRTDEIHRLEFAPEERSFYESVKAKTVGEIDAVLETPGARSCLNALQSISSLRLICNHGVIEKEEASPVIESKAQWNLDSAQQAFDSLWDIGQAYCMKCAQDLTFMMFDASDCRDTLSLQPRVSQDLQLLCPSCVEQRSGKLDAFLAVCNHLPRCTSSQSSGIGTPTAPPDNHDNLGSDTTKPASTKISSLIMSLSQCVTKEKRLA